MMQTDVDGSSDAGLGVIGCTKIWELFSRWITPDEAEIERAAVYTFRRSPSNGATDGSDGQVAEKSKPQPNSPRL